MRLRRHLNPHTKSTRIDLPSRLGVVTTPDAAQADGSGGLFVTFIQFSQITIEIAAEIGFSGLFESGSETDYSAFLVEVLVLLPAVVAETDSEGSIAYVTQGAGVQLAFSLLDVDVDSNSTVAGAISNAELNSVVSDVKSQTIGTMPDIDGVNFMEEFDTTMAGHDSVNLDTLKAFAGAAQMVLDGLIYQAGQDASQIGVESVFVDEFIYGDLSLYLDAVSRCYGLDQIWHNGNSYEGAVSHLDSNLGNTKWAFDEVDLDITNQIYAWLIGSDTEKPDSDQKDTAKEFSTLSPQD